MASGSHSTYKKRQKELARLERRRLKAAKRLERRQLKRAAEAGETNEEAAARSSGV